ncbi:LOW QUALITY PROTEIN: hypothetical protein GGTG_13758 [Gaeumannomyces tritici R3-111a-1]|uniref:Uncharacterized protein n=1 Tax=Gaeumannomyces tritici (strain R3-111a-1) TaxID=644352 RepID=J3PJR9_GAET3|nr:LOW QUALITY PROTEIN: hypothetical protein GGTG_13758 [Gaeumannomyces tritici R3-111a-1]EJT68674.1 LOW QUALITY PROTEIN: hypothetical protein GGTG_13758 [Gaeumannomyces tritici R3-111a-1]
MHSVVGRQRNSKSKEGSKESPGGLYTLTNVHPETVIQRISRVLPAGRSATGCSLGSFRPEEEEEEEYI